MNGRPANDAMPTAFARFGARERQAPHSLRPSTAVLLLVWSLLAAAALTQQVVHWLVPASGGEITLRSDRWLLALWAMAAPAILHSARRFPVRGFADVRRALAHGAAATLFIVAANILIRLPLLSAPHAFSVNAVGRDVMLGLARFYPAALLVYAAIVALGSREWGRSCSAPQSGLVQAVAATTMPPAAPPTGIRAERVLVREWNRVHLVRPADIAWIESDDNNVVVHAAGRVYKGRGRISDLAAQLDPARFVRVHRSAIVHVSSVREVQPLPKGDLALVLRDGKVLRVARSRRHALVTALALPL